MRAALAVGAILLAGWLTALALGVFGGFDSLPELKLGGDGNGQKQATAAPEPAGEVAGAKASSDTVNGVPTGGENTSSGGGGAPGTDRRPAGTRPVATAPAPTTTTTTPGNANGTSDTKTTGKPITTPGNGSTGSNAGGTGSGNAFGKYK